jgi:hypothetical protein
MSRGLGCLRCVSIVGLPAGDRVGRPLTGGSAIMRSPNTTPSKPRCLCRLRKLILHQTRKHPGAERHLHLNQGRRGSCDRQPLVVLAECWGVYPDFVLAVGRGVTRLRFSELEPAYTSLFSSHSQLVCDVRHIQLQPFPSLMVPPSVAIAVGHLPSASLEKADTAINAGLTRARRESTEF